jgi:hypothetical protein
MQSTVTHSYTTRIQQGGGPPKRSCCRAAFTQPSNRPPFGSRTPSQCVSFTRLRGTFGLLHPRPALANVLSISARLLFIRSTHQYPSFPDLLVHPAPRNHFLNPSILGSRRVRVATVTLPRSTRRIIHQPPVAMDDMAVGLPSSSPFSDSGDGDSGSYVVLDDMAVDEASSPTTHITEVASVINPDGSTEFTGVSAIEPEPEAPAQEIMSARAYQLEMLQQSLEHNVIVVVRSSPCGTLNLNSPDLDGYREREDTSVRSRWPRKIYSINPDET